MRRSTRWPNSRHWRALRSFKPLELDDESVTDESGTRTRSLAADRGHASPSLRSPCRTVRVSEWRPPPYLIDEFLADMSGGDNVVATVFVDADAMYRADGPAEYQVIGETEFANGQ